MIPMLYGSAKISHPSLLFTKERVGKARQAIKSDTAMLNAWRHIQSVANDQLSHLDISKMEYVALAYLMTDEEKYADCIKRVLFNSIENPGSGNSEMLARKPAWRSELKLAWNAQQAAIGYDAIYDRLDKGERKKLADGLYSVFVEPILGDWILEPTRIHTLNSMGHNWWTACVNGGALLALAIGNERPDAEASAREAVEAIPEWFNFSGDALHGKSRTFDRDGGMYEGVNYANYGISQALLLLLAWKNSHPDQPTEQIPQIADIPAFFCYMSYPRTGDLYNVNFGDSHRNVTGEYPMILAYVLGYRSPDTLWYINQVNPGQFREGLPLNTPLGLLYTPQNNAAPTSPNLPLSHIWKDFGWATMRDSWDKDATMLAVKSGMTWNHSHADANSFILFHNGVDIIKDAGNCSYPKKLYREYFFQSDAHNVVKFDGQGQPRHQQYHGTLLPGSVSDLLDGGNIKYVLANGTGPMSQWFNRNFRHFLWIDNVIFIIDDIESHEAGKFEWLWHPGGDAVKKGFDLNISKDNSAVAVRPLYPRLLANSDFVHDYPDDLYWEVMKGPAEDLKSEEEYYSFHLPATTNKIKGVTAIILKDSVGQKKLPLMERREGKDWIGVRMTYNGKVTDIYINQLADGRLMHSNPWIEADGWETDAYMFSVSYPEGGKPSSPDEFFICYGSSLRRDEDMYFSSLSKLNIVNKYEGSEQTIIADGQPRIRCKVKGSPKKLLVNGNNVDVKKSGNLVAIRCDE